MQTGAEGQEAKKKGSGWTLTIYNVDGERIEVIKKLSVWDAVRQAQAAQDKGLRAKVTPPVPQKVLDSTRRNR